MERSISFTLNGKATRITVDEDRMLLWVLRSDLGLTGTKCGCGQALCGACTVVLDNQAVRSCVTSIKEVAGKQLLTIEGLAQDGKLHPIQEAFARHHAFQCGFCTPGMILTAYALLAGNPHASHDEIVSQMDDNLCRCGSHPRVLDAIEEVAAPRKGGER
jgi:carbon-monoxide dehydrogenase small subunit